MPGALGWHESLLCSVSGVSLYFMFWCGCLCEYLQEFCII